MVIDALHNIAGHLCVEKGDRQVHQFDKKVGYERNVNPCAEMEQYPTPDDFHTRSTYKQKELRNKNQINKVDVLVLDTNIDHALSKKRKNKLEKTAYEQAESELNQKLLIPKEILVQKRKAPSGFFIIRFYLFEPRCGFQK